MQKPPVPSTIARGSVRVPVCVPFLSLLLSLGCQNPAESESTASPSTGGGVGTSETGGSTAATDPLPTTGGPVESTVGTDANSTSEATTGPGPTTTTTTTTTTEPVLTTGPDTTVEPDTDSTGSNEAGTGDEDCAFATIAPNPVPLDIHVMLDRSGSMISSLPMNKTRWQAVTEALAAFFNDPQSAGIGAGLSYFGRPPIADLPVNYTTDADCGLYGPCAANDCAFAFGSDSCDPADYVAPDVAIAELNGAAAALVASMQAHSPTTATPTAPALQGAITHASTWAAANPSHQVVVVFVTDGEPSWCDVSSSQIIQIAANGLAGAPSVSTFVIGVFPDGEPDAEMLLNEIAAAGGTGAAFNINNNVNVGQEFLAALEAIRESKLGCEFEIPDPPPNEFLDYQEVNVLHTPEGLMDPTAIPYVTSLDGCLPGGWYYDVDPMFGGTPTKILMCPDTCTSFGVGGKVDIQLGCKTLIPG